METRFLLRATQRLKPSPSLRHQLRYASSKSSTQQATPIGDYYTSLLESSTPTITSKPPTTASASSTPPISSKEAHEEDSGPAILFSSRLSSPLERRSKIQKKSVLIAGVWVPSRPGEPDNCCMSGCVNCVWDQYRDELEEWAAARKEADVALRKEKGLEKGKRRRKHGQEVSGTGLETDFTGEELFSGVPVGIREFMKQEKWLKEKHAREGTTG
jgi:hypothetical protein